MIDAQMELSLETKQLRAARARGSKVAPNTRRWWFDRMREIVDRARDWQPAPPPRPEQVTFGSLYRQASASLGAATSRVNAQEQLVCE